MDRIVKWDITNKCNMRCQYCSTAAQRHGATDLKFEEIKRCIDVLTPFARKISLLGGEPTCLQRFPEVVKYIKKKGLGVEVVTNGLKIDCLTQVLDFVDRIVISIDGPDSKIYGTFRDARYFEKVLNNARFLAARVPVDINCVVHKHNFKILNQMLNLAHDIGAQGINFLQFIPPSIPQAKDLVLAAHEEIEAVILLGEGIKSMKEADLPIINARFTYPLVVDYVNKAYGFTIPLPTHMCGAGLTFVYVNQRGELFPCDRIAASWPQALRNSLVDHSIEEIVTNDLFSKALVFQASFDTYRAWDPCNKCPYLRKICFPCPVVSSGIAERATVAVCKVIENSLEVEVLPHTLYYIEPDKSRGVVFNPLHNSPLELNKTAVEIFETIQPHNSVKAVLEEVARRYNKEVHEVYDDVLQTINTLCKHGIIRYRLISLG